MIISRSIHVTAHGIYSFLNELSNIPLCVCVCVSLLFGAFNPFTFKVIIHMYVLIAILLIASGLLLSVFFLPFLFCSLTSDDCLSCCVWTAFSFLSIIDVLVCSYQEVLA